MARALNKLTDRTCRAAGAGLLSDGGGLYLNVKPNGSKSWVYVWRQAGKRSEMGLGAYPAVKLAQARELAAQCRIAVAEGRNPITERKKEVEPTFWECAQQFFEAKLDEFRNDKHKAQWRSTLATYAAPIHDKRVSAITTDDVLRVLNPIWQSKAETASRLRGRIERVLDFAKGKGWRSGENPALWRGHLSSILPARKKLSRGHHAAMPYAEVPAFIEALAEREAFAARGLTFLILTAARSGEVLGAKWDEIDYDAQVWTVPAGRMKAGKVHRVPLTAASLDLLKRLNEVRVSEFIFPGMREGKPLSNMTFEMQMRRMGAQAFTVHGFRSSFRDWVGDETDFAPELAEAALAHTIGDATERAYRRRDALERRRGLMEAWAAYCASAN